MKLKRIEAGRYETADGLFMVWHAIGLTGEEDRWYVNHPDFDETLMLGGFPRKWQAVKWLKELYDEKPEWIRWE